LTGLSGRVIAVSVNDAPDRARLGFPAREVDRSLFSICTVLVRAGARIVYSGDLSPDGLTFRMFRHLAGAYAGTQQVPFVHVVPEPILRRTIFDDLLAALREGSSVASTQLHINGALLPVRAVEDGLRVGENTYRLRLRDEAAFKAWLATKTVLPPALGYSAGRAAATKIADARIVIGGKMGLLAKPDDAYEGSMPGIVEEAILALELGKPCVPLGAFGGAARDVAIALGVLDPAKAVPRGDQLPTYAPSLARVAELRNLIPSELVPALSALADDDRGEPMAYEVAKVLVQWLEG